MEKIRKKSFCRCQVKEKARYRAVRSKRKLDTDPPRTTTATEMIAAIMKLSVILPHGLITFWIILFIVISPLITVYQCLPLYFSLRRLRACLFFLLMVLSTSIRRTNAAKTPSIILVALLDI